MPAGRYPAMPVTTPTRKPDRVTYDQAVVHAVLDEGLVAHVGFVVDGAPVVLPHLCVRMDDELFLHGSSGARALRLGLDGLAACVTVTLTDGLVLARAALNHPLNYRSVVVHGEARVVNDEMAKHTVPAALADAVVSGRSAHVRGPSRKELAKTGVLSLPLEQVSLKVRGGPPHDDPADLELPYWAGVLPLVSQVPGTPQESPDLAPGVDVPAHVTGWRRPGR